MKKDGCPPGFAKVNGECMSKCRIYAVKDSVLDEGANVRDALSDYFGIDQSDIAYLGMEKIHADDF